MEAVDRARQLLQAWRSGDDGSNFRSDELEELVSGLRKQVQRFTGTSLRFIDWCRICHYRLENETLHPVGQNRCLAVSKASGSEWVKELLYALEVVLTLIDDHADAEKVVSMRAELTDARVRLSDMKADLRGRDERDERRFNLTLGTVLKANGVLRYRSLSKVRQFISHLDKVKEEFGIRDDGEWVEIDEEDVLVGEAAGGDDDEWGSWSGEANAGNSEDSEEWDIPDVPESIQQRRREVGGLEGYAEGGWGRSSSRRGDDDADELASQTSRPPSRLPSPPSRLPSRQSDRRGEGDSRASSRRSSASPSRQDTSGRRGLYRRDPSAVDISRRSPSDRRRRHKRSSSRRRQSSLHGRDDSAVRRRSSTHRRRSGSSSRRHSSARRRRSTPRRHSSRRDGRRGGDSAEVDRRPHDRHHRRRRSRSESSDETIRASSSHPVETIDRHRRRSESESVHADATVMLGDAPVFPGLNEPGEGVELKHMLGKGGPMCGGFGSCTTAKDYLKMLEHIKFGKTKPGESEVIAYLKAEADMLTVFDSVCPRTVNIYDLLSVFANKAAIWKHAMGPLLAKEGYYTSFKMFLGEFRQKQWPNMAEICRAEAEKRVQGPKESIDKYFEDWVELQGIVKYRIDDRTDHFIEGLRDSRIKRLVAQENYAGRERTVEAVKQHAVYLSGRFMVQETVAENKKGRRVAAVSLNSDMSDKDRHSDSKKPAKSPKVKSKVSKVASTSAGHTDNRPKLTSDETKLKRIVEWGRKAGVKGCFNCFQNHTFRLDFSNCSNKCPICKSDFNKNKRHLTCECPKLPSDKNSISEIADRVLKEDQKRSK